MFNIVSVFVFVFVGFLKSYFYLILVFLACFASYSLLAVLNFLRVVLVV